MGAFFTNVQVRTDLRGAEATHKCILETLAARADREGFSPCAEGAHADRTIVVGPPGRWIAIYDEATEDQRLEPLDELTRAMSEIAGGPAVGVLVHDSDWLLLRLFDAGCSVDAFERGVDKEKGTLAAWASLCEREEDIASAFTRRDLHAEDTLRDIASAVGIAPTNASTGYEYLRDEGPFPDSSTVLRWRLRERPAHEQLATGAPRLTLAFHQGEKAELSVGGALHLGIAVRNEGGASRGMMIAVHGDAIETGLVEPERIDLIVGPPQRGRTIIGEPLVRRNLTNNRPGYVAEWPQVEVPAGTAGGLPALAAVGPSKLVELMHASQVHANVHATGRVAGAARMFVSFVPLAAREAQFHYAVDVSVVPTTHKGNQNAR